MSTAPQKQPLTVAEYLAGERVAKQKHEYVNGVAYAMAGASARHNRIASNATGLLYRQLLNKPCEVFNSHMKIRIRQQSSTRFYYPDLSVVCQSNPDQDHFQDYPVVVIEVISVSTRRLDEFEKREAYLSINSLSRYILLEQNSPSALLYRRTDDGFQPEYYQGLETIIPLDEIDCQLSFAEIYNNVDFPPMSLSEDGQEYELESQLD